MTMTPSKPRFPYTMEEAEAIAQLVDLLDNKLKPFLRSLTDSRETRSMALIESSMKSLDRVIDQIEECQAM